MADTKTAPTAAKLDPFLEATRKRSKAPGIIVLVVVVLVAAGVGVWFLRPQKVETKFITGKVTRGDVVESVESTGTVQPLLQVQVGSQVSGRVGRVLVDFNSIVKEGQLLAEIDTEPFRAQLAQATAVVASNEAQVVRARADLALAEKNLERQHALAAKSLNAPTDVDQAEGARAVAAAQLQVTLAQLDQSKAQLTSSKTNLGYTRIVSPIAGVVVSRNVDPGQTVAASLQSPTLFLIAHDLKQMEVLASIDEADVGKVKQGLDTHVHVDAFPQDQFKGQVRELRYQPTTTAGVVTYPAVIDVPNPEQKLRPGMTATISLETSKDTNVLRVPNAALRFEPAPLGTKPAMPGAPGAAASGASKPVRGAKQHVYLLVDGKPQSVTVEVGISDGFVTEVSPMAPDTLEVDAEVVLDEVDTAQTGAPGAPGGAAGKGGGGRAPRMF